MDRPDVTPCDPLCPFVSCSTCPYQGGVAGHDTPKQGKIDEEGPRDAGTRPGA